MVTFIVLCVAIAMCLVEQMGVGRKWAMVSRWCGRALLLNGCQASLIYFAGVFWDPWLREHRPWSVDGLGEFGSAMVGYVAITFIYYWWHRCRHEVPLLWRWLHQLHHSPQRIEVITSFYKHPFEIFINSVLSSAILYLLVGTSPEAASIAVLITGIAELFYHWNIRTPYWLGYVIQRPEMHCVHHQEGIHRFNFSDLPLWDMCFGTWRNPRSFTARCGFGEGEHRFGAMLIGRLIDPSQKDVHVP
jgi:sterol desaturase/sphingolipid hydroxylase (fatty acid hydroxylase superfamily)